MTSSRGNREEGRKGRERKRKEEKRKRGRKRRRGGEQLDPTLAVESGTIKGQGRMWESGTLDLTR